MSKKVTPKQYADPKGVIVEGFDGNAVFCNGATVPTNGLAGFAPGCVFVRRGGAGGSSFYINEGSATSCLFVAQPRMVRGEVALDGSNPTPVATGLTTIVAAVATIKRTDALSSGTAFVTVDFTGSNGTLNLYGWVAAGTASTGTETVEYVAFGT